MIDNTISNTTPIFYDATVAQGKKCVVVKRDIGRTEYIFNISMNKFEPKKN